MSRTFRRLNAPNTCATSYNVLKNNDRRGWIINRDIIYIEDTLQYTDNVYRHVSMSCLRRFEVWSTYSCINRDCKEESVKRRRIDWRKLKYKIAMNDNEYDLPEDIRDEHKWHNREHFYDYF